MTPAQDWEFLFECDKACRTSISGKDRFIQFRRSIPLLQSVHRILDVGGNPGTARWLRVAFPESTVTTMNSSVEEIGDHADAIQADAQNFDLPGQFDLVFAGEIIEHVYNPDGLLGSCLLALRPNGYLVITTPNLACFYNRLFLLMWWSLGNSFASLRYIVGNPFMAETSGCFGIVADHKSVFAWTALCELLRLYGVRVLATAGYSYAQHEAFRCMGELEYRAPMPRIRFLLNRLLPKKLREGMLFVCQRPDNFDEFHAHQGRLRETVWKLHSV